MANKYGRVRADVNKNRPAKYKSTYDETGKVNLENKMIKAFWREHKMKDIIQLTPEELDQAIDKTIEAYKDRRIKDDPNWWFPVQDKKSYTEARKKLDKKNE